jgi:hypothetical protein
MLASYSSARDKGLYVSQKAATSFEVHELGGGASSVSFDYRIVALRKNFENIRIQDHTKDLDPARLWKSSKVVAPEKVGDVHGLDSDGRPDLMRAESRNDFDQGHSALCRSLKV